MDRIRVGVVGLGWVALNRHLPVLARSRRFEVVGVIDRSEERARHVAGKNGFKNYSSASDLSQVEWIRDIDAITVSIPPMERYSIVKQALVLGKHVLTEKPFAMSVKEGSDLVESANSNQRCLGIVHNFQFARAMKRLLVDIEAGRLGQILSVDAIQLGNPSRRLPELALSVTAFILIIAFCYFFVRVAEVVPGPALIAASALALIFVLGPTFALSAVDLEARAPAAPAVLIAAAAGCFLVDQI